MNQSPETVETQAWSDRELLLRTYYQTVETNGSVRQLRAVVYGSDEQGLVGLVAQAHDNTLYRERAKTAVKLIGSVLAAALGILTTILVLILEHVL